MTERDEPLETPVELLVQQEQRDAEQAERDASIATMIYGELCVSRHRSVQLWAQGPADHDSSYKEARLFHSLVNQYLILTGAYPGPLSGD